MPKISKIRVLTDEELNSEIIAAKRRLFELRLRKATGQLEKTHELKHTRHYIAQLLTVERERQLKALADKDRKKEEIQQSLSYGKIKFPNKVRVGKEYPLDVIIEVSTKREFDNAKDLFTLGNINTYLLTSPYEFDVRSPEFQVIKLTPELKSSQSPDTTFILKPKRQGKAIVGVEFFNNSRYLGRAEIQTKMV